MIALRSAPILQAGLLLGLVALTTVMADRLTPRERMADHRNMAALSDLVPRKIGSWTLDDRQAVLQPSPDVQVDLAAIYTELLGRTYVDPAGYRIMLSVAYVARSANGNAVHRPEVCYPAQGFAVRHLHDGSVTVGGVPLRVVRATMERPPRNEPVTYWIVVGDRAAAGAWDVRWIQLKYNLQGTVPDALLVRISSIDGNAAKAFAEHERFARDLEQALTAPQRSRVFGERTAGREH
jgi:EpsI family protein